MVLFLFFLDFWYKRGSVVFFVKVGLSFSVKEGLIFGKKLKSA